MKWRPWQMAIWEEGISVINLLSVEIATKSGKFVMSVPSTLESLKGTGKVRTW